MVIELLVKSICSRGTCLEVVGGLIGLNEKKVYLSWSVFASGGLFNFSLDLFLPKIF